MTNTNTETINRNERAHYTKWRRGWIAGGGWAGRATLRGAWDEAQRAMPATGCSWYALGLLMATQQRKGRQLEAAEWSELIK